MPIYLSVRDTDSEERMDNPDCDRVQLYNTYKNFEIVNGLISRWHRIYKSYILPDAQKIRSSPVTILDIGFGGGDIPLKLAQWASEDGIPVHITAIDTDTRALDFVHERKSHDHVTFRKSSSSDLVEQREKFHYVISNHLLHHLDDAQFTQLTAEAEQLSTRKVLFNDIERSDVAYLFFNLTFRPFFRNSFITHDGLLSIRRSYTYDELYDKKPVNWNLKRLFPYRLLLSYTHEY